MTDREWDNLLDAQQVKDELEQHFNRICEVGEMVTKPRCKDCYYFDKHLDGLCRGQIPHDRVHQDNRACSVFKPREGV